MVNHIDYEMFSGKYLLVTGATGMIGSQIIKRILHYNSEHNEKSTIVAFYRNKEKRNRLFGTAIDDPNVKWVCCDINEKVELDCPIDYIIHTAGVTGGSKQHVDMPIRTISTALNGTVNMLELAREKKVLGFVYLSSLEVYGITDFNLPYIRETDYGYLDPMIVRSSYSESKRMCETTCVAYAKQYKVPTKVVRLAPTYGDGAAYEDNRVLCEFARCIIEKHDIVLKSLGDTVRNYCDVSDAVSAIFLVLLKGEVGEAYNVANMDTAISIRDLAEKFVNLYPEAGVGLKFEIPEDITKLGYNQTVKIKLDSNKILKLGWSPQVDVDGMIQNLVASMKRNKEK